MNKIFLKEIIEKPITGEWGSEGNDVKVLRTTNFSNNGFLKLKSIVNRSIPKQKIDKKKLCKGDIIIEKSGGGPNQPVGRVVFFDIEGEYLCNNFTAILRPKTEKTFPKYLHYLLFASHKFRVTEMFQNKTTGIINLQLSRYVEKLQIPLPDLKTQKQIASILDDAQALKQKTEQILKEYDELAQSIFLDMFGDPLTNPKGWEKERLESFGYWKSGGTPSRNVPEYFEGNIPWLSSGELNEMYVSNSKERITDTAISMSNAKLIEPGSLLLGMYDTAALKSSISTSVLSCNQAIAYSKIDSDKADIVYLYYLIQIGKEHYRRLQRGVRQKNLNLSMIKSMQIISPALTLQNQFAEKIKLIEQQKELAKQELKESEDLFQALLQKAFKGELV